jgi:WD40-like Beta Propeller Repeat
MVQQQLTAAPQPPHSDVRDQLARILSSELFARSSRLSQFLSFIVEETLAGRGDSLKVQTLAMSLYEKSAGFNAAADPIVRVDARRLRDKLREYYASAPVGSLVILVPKGTYTPIFEWANPASVAVEHTVVRRSARRGWAIAALTLLALGAAVLWMLRTQPSEPDNMRLFTVTSFPGWEGHPGISPDGNFVAFARTGPDLAAPNDLWVTAVEGDAPRRLTDTPTLHEAGPVWSPDGREIAFFALDGTTSRVCSWFQPLAGPPGRSQREEPRRGPRTADRWWSRAACPTTHSAGLLCFIVTLIQGAVDSSHRRRTASPTTRQPYRPTARRSPLRGARDLVRRPRFFWSPCPVESLFGGPNGDRLPWASRGHRMVET